MCQNSNGSAGEPKSMVFAWVSWRKIMELRVSYETFAKNAPGHPAAPDPGEAPEGEAEAEAEAKAEAEAEEGGRRAGGGRAGAGRKNI